MTAATCSAAGRLLTFADYAQINGKSQFTDWFTYVLLVFVICTLLTEIIFLNVSAQQVGKIGAFSKSRTSVQLVSHQFQGMRTPCTGGDRTGTTMSSC